MPYLLLNMSFKILFLKTSIMFPMCFSRMTDYFSHSSAVFWSHGTACLLLSSTQLIIRMGGFCPSCSSSIICPSHSLLTFFYREGSHSGSALLLESELHELLLNLMCQFAPEKLLNFLQTSQHYRLEEAIQVLTVLYLCHMSSLSDVGPHDSIVLLFILCLVLVL